MGALTSRHNVGDDEVDVGSNHTYRYPPKSGSYFGGHFIMGGERFEATQPEAYLFGENLDLNFLGSRPSPFPYPAPQPNEPTKTLRSLINIRKESLKLVRSSECVRSNGQTLQFYNVEFTFDSDVRCSIIIHYFCTEEITPTGIVYSPRDPFTSSEAYHYKVGANQQFCQVTHTFCPNYHLEEELCYGPDSELLPVVIQCVAEEGDDPKQSHITIAIIETSMEGSHIIKPLKQKQFVDGLCYLLQEIYGIENKNAEQTKNPSDDDVDDNGSECVICMSDIRNTLILPCRHLCLCNNCADSLRYQANNCPICRSPFRALLQIQALRKITSNSLPGMVNVNPLNNSSESQDSNIPQGYESLSLLEALNGTSHVNNGAPSLATANSETSRDSPLIPKRHMLSRMLSGSNASLQGRRKNLNYKVSNVSLSEPNVTNVGKDKVAIVPIDFEDGKPDIKNGLLNSNDSIKSATYPRPADTIHVVNELSRKKLPKSKAETVSMKSLQKSQGSSDKDAVKLSASDSLNLAASEDEEEKLDVDVASPLAADEDSDYYTPEDPSPGDLVDENTNEATPTKETTKTPCLLPVDGELNDEPPLDQDSKRSSTDSFSSTSSASNLLKDDKQNPTPQVIPSEKDNV